MSKKLGNTFVLSNPTEILQALVGLKDVKILRLERRGPDVELVIEREIGVVVCPRCRERARVKDRPVVSYVDLPVYASPMTLTWKKHRLRCVNVDCPVTTWMVEDHRIAAKGCLLTTRAAKWATNQVGQGRTVSEVADELNCDWHTVNDAVLTYGEALLAADKKRRNQTTAIGLDETNFVKLGTHLHASYATTVADVQNHQIIEILPTRRYEDVAAWVNRQPASWKERIAYGALDMSPAYAAVYSVALPQAAQVVDPYHVIALANRSLDAVRRRVQVEQLGHRGRRDDPLYRARRVLLLGEEKLDESGSRRLQSLLELGDPNAEVALAYRVKERLRDFYRTFDPVHARAMLDELKGHCLRREMPPEIQKLGRTIRDWFDKICNFHLARISNGPTEALNNLIKRIKRIGFGFRNFQNYRIRALLYAGKPNWRVLDSIVVR
ncbi:MAG: ISL3 family transposase [Acidobacteriota bacterium]|nr:ISL3 family transposase [Acidobacteriota bacterium]MDE3045018.1 ISL3 family transposase [Acidobacteriota bacterium]